MAPISKTIAWAALAAIVSARPLMVARQQAPEMITETKWVTVDVPVTLWVDENGTPLSTVAQGGNFAAVATTSSNGVAPVVTSASASVSTIVHTVTSTTTLAPVAPKAPVQAPSPSTSSVAPPTTPVPTTPATPSTSAAPTTAYVPSTTQQLGRQESTASPAASTAAAAGGSTGAVSASDSNSCVGSGAACVGDITHYDGGLGACGWNVNTASDMQIALPAAFMGEQSNGNPYCGRSLTIKNPSTGQTVSATVGDKCMGCSGRSIDLTDALFNAIGNGCDGRCSGFQWWFN